MQRLAERQVGFQSLSYGIDTATAGGRLVFHIMGALAEFERALIQERTVAGLQAARRRGKRLGRPPALSTEQVAHARREMSARASPAPNAPWDHSPRTLAAQAGLQGKPSQPCFHLR